MESGDIDTLISMKRIIGGLAVGSAKQVRHDLARDRRKILDELRALGCSHVLRVLPSPIADDFDDFPDSIARIECETLVVCTELPCTCECMSETSALLVPCVEAAVKRVHELSGRASGGQSEEFTGVLIVDEDVETRASSGVGMATGLAIGYAAAHVCHGGDDVEDQASTRLRDAAGLVRRQLQKARPAPSAPFVNLLKEWFGGRFGQQSAEAGKYVGKEECAVSPSSPPRSPSAAEGERPSSPLEELQVQSPKSPTMTSGESSGPLGEAAEIEALRRAFEDQTAEWRRQIAEAELNLERDIQAVRQKYADTFQVEEEGDVAIESVDGVAAISGENETAPSDKEVEGTAPDEPSQLRVYCCRQCRTQLFTEDDVVEHSPADGQSAFSWKKRERSNADVSCTSLFLEEQEWMSAEESPDGILNGNSGKLYCPNHAKCSARVGSFCWSGSQCSCGHWCAPALQVLHSRVDEKFVPRPSEG